ncbi:MAG TPA: response regulator, partial [Anaeromyxobacteraceae bacterium]
MKRPRLLLVVPDADAAASLRVALAEHGFDVRLAGCAEEAILAAPSFAPDVVLAEVDELEDGPLLLRGLAEQGADAAVVVVAAAADRLAAAVEALRAGAESY